VVLASSTQDKYSLIINFLLLCSSRACFWCVVNLCLLDFAMAAAARIQAHSLHVVAASSSSSSSMSAPDFLPAFLSPFLLDVLLHIHPAAFR
jgi:hypothetical protein